MCAAMETVYPGPQKKKSPFNGVRCLLGGGILPNNDISQLSYYVLVFFS